MKGKLPVLNVVGLGIIAYVIGIVIDFIMPAIPFVKIGVMIIFYVGYVEPRKGDFWYYLAGWVIALLLALILVTILALPIIVTPI